MIDIVVGRAGTDVAEVVIKAFERSFTRGQVRIVDGPQDVRAGVVVVLAASDADAPWLEDLLRRPCKVMLFGPIDRAPARIAGIVLSPIEPPLQETADCAPTPAYETTASQAAIVYAARGLGACSPLRRRHLCRFDFTSEWNNLGYGRIGLGDGPWSIAVTAQPLDAVVVGELVLGDDPAAVGAVATLRDTPSASILWFARPVGPIDGADWRIIEAFVSDHREASLPCRPHLRDVPHGVAAAVTMRLDCDEAVGSVRPLFDLYRSRKRPLSVAIATGQPDCAQGVDVLATIGEAGGSILSHSVTHPPNWGGSAAAAEAEARESKAWLERHVPGATIRYAVSPFHQNPSYVPQALARAGYQGFVGGVICNDPEYLMARGGAVPHGPDGFVSHSQSCMLHGDCMLSGPDPLRVYGEAFRIARLSGQFFGYLDHPFSPRYSYGWVDEAQRLRMHAAFLDAMTAECATAGAPLLFVNEDICLDFMRDKAATEIVFDAARDAFDVSRQSAAGLPLSIGFRGRNRAADA